MVAAMPKQEPMELLTELMSSSAGRRELSQASPVFFDSYYCGMRWAAHRQRWLEEFEREFQLAKQTQQKRGLLVLAPRDHGKTEACVTFTAQKMCEDRNIRILWIAEAAGNAEKRVRRVKALLQSEKVSVDWCTAEELGYGPWVKTEEDKWGARQVYLNRQIQSVDPTLEAVGSGGAITGGHFDIIMCDDLEDDRTTFSEAQRGKTREWFRGTVRPMLARDGVMIVIGTRKHYDDLYGHLLNDATFRVMEDKAIIRWPKSHRFSFDRDDKGREVIREVHVEGEGEVLWPEERPLEYLLRERYAVGSLLFSREFQNEVQDDAAAAFKMSWLEYARSQGAGLSLYQIPELPDGESLDIVQGWDLSLTTDVKKAEKHDSDYSVGVTWARDKYGNRYLLGFRRERGMTHAKLKTLVESEYYKFGRLIRTVAVERNSFGELHYLGIQRTTDLPLKAHLTDKKKADPWEGVPSLSALFENGKVIIPSATADDRAATQPLIDELWGLGRESHDDSVLALWIAETVLRKSGFVYSVSFGEDSEILGTAEERISTDDFDQDDENPAAAGAKAYRNEAEKAAAESAWGDLPFGR